jgi:hypothetical protein
MAIALTLIISVLGPKLFFILLVSVISLGFYFLPTIAGRNKKNIKAIFVLNLLLGWTLIGWVVALVWALVKEVQMVEF